MNFGRPGLRIQASDVHFHLRYTERYFKEPFGQNSCTSHLGPQKPTKRLLLELQDLLNTTRKEVKELQVVKTKLKNCRAEMVKFNQSKENGTDLEIKIDQLQRELYLSNLKCIDLQRRLKQEEASNVRLKNKTTEMEEVLSDRATSPQRIVESYRHCRGVSLEKLKVCCSVLHIIGP